MKIKEWLLLYGISSMICISITLGYIGFTSNPIFSLFDFAYSYHFVILYYGAFLLMLISLFQILKHLYQTIFHKPENIS